MIAFVAVLPEWLSSPQEDQEVNDGDRVELRCMADGEPRPNITWTFNGKETLPPGSNKLAEGNLVLPSVSKSPEYEGEYTCTAQNAAGMINATTTLTIKGKWGFIP